MTPSGPRDDLGEAQPYQEMPTSSRKAGSESLGTDEKELLKSRTSPVRNEIFLICRWLPLAELTLLALTGAFLS